MDAQAYLAECVTAVDGLLDRAVPASEEEPSRLHQAMRHLLFPGGKRLRPALACAAAEAVGASREVALPMAAAVELVHTYSLVHDDLPCMDDDDTRRGRPTVHVAFGEALAVLAGDALLAAAFEVLASAKAPAARRLAALEELARASGSRQLVGGQVDDLAATPPIDRERVESVHRRKTAALISAAVVGGGLLGGGDKSSVRRLRRFGQAVGLGFQIADDLLDRDEDGGCSWVAVMGVEAARAETDALLARALDEVEAFGQRAEPLRELGQLAVRRDR
jgi:geranylgeranyl diphosphate synthase type II